MSRGSVESPPAVTDREPVDRLVLRMPAAAGLIRGFIVRMRPGPVRRRLVKLWVDRAFAAVARNDVEVALQGYDPAVELWMRGMDGVGVSECYRGHEGIRAFWSDFDDAFVDWRWTVQGVVDGGDRIAIHADFNGYGRGSGAQITIRDGGTAVRLSQRGQVTWQAWFTEQDGWKKALEAAGLSE